MTNDFISDPVFPDCPIRNVLARIGGKWTMAVLYTLDKSGTPLRFRDIERLNHSQDRAQSLMPLLHQLMDWAYHNLHDIVTDREHFYGKDGE